MSRWPSLVPEALIACGVEEFMRRLPQYDAAMAKTPRRGAGAGQGAALRRAG